MSVPPVKDSVTPDQNQGQKRGRFDSMIDRAFAPPKTPDGSPKMSPKDLNRLSMSGDSVTSPPEIPDTPQTGTLEPIWEKVRQAKEKRLAKLPSKVQSLEVVQEISGSSKEGGQSQGTLKKPTKPNSGITFKETSDGREVIATIEMSGVKKEDMHVSFKGNRVVVTWRKTRMIEKKEGEILVRERLEKQYSQVFPLPEGTQFEEIKAGRDGRRLILTYPNIRHPRHLTNSSATVVSQSGATEYYTCLAE
ncbi:unnamed protein product [Somion occarium]|uniref:SHSP domain-containing protein n=1 Tax=Somion occarium TaxID=3059160 RepID=A0ABP1E7Q5_9APHY